VATDKNKFEKDARTEIFKMFRLSALGHLPKPNDSPNKKTPKEVARARRYPRGARAGLSAEGSLCESEKVYGRSLGDFLPFLKANRCGSEASVHEVDQQLRRNFRHELEQKLSPNFRHELHQKYSNPVFPSQITPAVTSEFP